jgi:hypothetical protein
MIARNTMMHTMIKLTAIAALALVVVSHEKHARAVATNNPPTEEEITGVAAVDPGLPAWEIDGTIPLDNGQIMMMQDPK